MKAKIGYAAVAVAIVVAVVAFAIALSSRDTLADRANERCAAHNGVSRIDEQTIICRDGHAADDSR